MSKDVLGRELKEGDYVVFAEATGRSSAILGIGRFVRHGTKTIGLLVPWFSWGTNEGKISKKTLMDADPRRLCVIPYELVPERERKVFAEYDAELYGHWIQL